MSWDDILSEGDWITLPSEGAIGHFEGTPCVLRTGPNYDLRCGLPVHEAHCEQVLREAEELLRTPNLHDGAVWHSDGPETFLRLRRDQPRRRLPRLPHEKERRKVGLDSFVVTDDELEFRDDGRTIWDYNCLGSCLELRTHVRFDGDGGEYLKRLGFLYSENPSDSGTVVVLYVGRLGCHVAKRLRDDWYDSKCGEGGIRIVYRLVDTWGTEYGKRQKGFWVLTAEAKQAAAGRLQAPPIEDSASEYGDALWRMVSQLSA